LRDYFAAIERAGISVNVASYVGEGTVWECAMGSSFERPGPAEFRQMKELLAEAMNDGAFGLSTALMMPPSSLATTDDLIELCKVVRDYGGIYATHMRNEGVAVLEAIDEAVRIGKEGQVPVEIWHLKVAGKQNWGRMPEVVARINAARAAGVDVTADTYAYPLPGR
jgi:dihydroorotase/N-acyl-D-amino-acid deacylase